MGEPTKSGVDKMPSMSGDGAKIRTPMKGYEAKSGKGKVGGRGKK